MRRPNPTGLISCAALVLVLAGGSLAQAGEPDKSAPAKAAEEKPVVATTADKTADKTVDKTAPANPADPGDPARGRELLVQAAASAGDSALAAIKDFTVQVEGTYTLPVAEIKVTRKNIRKLPDCEWVEQKLTMGTSSQAVCGNQAWLKNGNQVNDMSTEMLQGVQSTQKRDLLYILLHPTELDARALAQPAEVDGRPATLLAVTSEFVHDWKIYVDNETHQIVRQDYTDPSAGDKGLKMSEIYSDFRTVNGLTWPYARKILREGNPFGTLNVTQLAFNTGVDESIFNKPAF